MELTSYLWLQLIIDLEARGFFVDNCIIVIGSGLRCASLPSYHKYQITDYTSQISTSSPSPS